MRFFATPPVDGALCDYVTIGAAFAHAVPDTISDDAAALCEPLSVGIAAVRKAGLTGGSSVLIAGAGPIGIVAAQVARAYGATDIIVTDLDESRRQSAREFGATTVVDPATDDVSALRVDAFIDASGAPAAVMAGIRAVRPAGLVVLVGTGAETMPLPTQLIQNRELVLTGVFRYANTWPSAIALVERGLVDLDAMVTGSSRWRRPRMLWTPTAFPVASRPWCRSHETGSIHARAVARSQSRAMTVVKSVSG